MYAISNLSHPDSNFLILRMNPFCSIWAALDYALQFAWSGRNHKFPNINILAKLTRFLTLVLHHRRSICRGISCNQKQNNKQGGFSHLGSLAISEQTREGSKFDWIIGNSKVLLVGFELLLFWCICEMTLADEARAIPSRCDWWESNSRPTFRQKVALSTELQPHHWKVVDV